MNKIEIWDVDVRRMETEIKEWKDRAIKAEQNLWRLERIVKQRRYARNYYDMIKREKENLINYNRERGMKEISTRMLNKNYYCKGRYEHISEYMAGKKIENLINAGRSVDKYVKPYLCKECHQWHIEKAMVLSEGDEMPKVVNEIDI